MTDDQTRERSKWRINRKEREGRHLPPELRT